MTAALDTPKPLADGNPVEAPDAASGMKPVLLSKVIVTTKPSALVSTLGRPALKQVAAGVSGVTNANTVILKTTTPAAWWTLISGRWFTASDLKGPWTYSARSQLPPSFRSLPKTGRLAAAERTLPSHDKRRRPLRATALLFESAVIVRRDAAGFTRRRRSRCAGRREPGPSPTSARGRSQA